MPDASQTGTFPIPEQADEEPEIRSGTKELPPEAAAVFEAKVAELQGLIPAKPGGISWVPDDESDMDRRDRVGIEAHGLNEFPWPDDPKPEPEAPIASETALSNFAKAFRG